jgi:hypothetical protein
MAAMRTCLVAIVVALGFLFLEKPTVTAAVSETTAPMSERQQEVESLLRRLNKTPLATIEVEIDV